jgi:hypothetical protein
VHRPDEHLPVLRWADRPHLDLVDLGILRPRVADSPQKADGLPNQGAAEWACRYLSEADHQGEEEEWPSRTSWWADEKVQTVVPLVLPKPLVPSESSK